MADLLLNTNATVLCSHGARVSFTTSNQRVKAGGQPIVTLGDSNSISGCPFQIPVVVGTKLQPCVRVQWAKAASRVRVGGQPVLLQSSSGVCLSGEGITQSAPNIVDTQTRLRGS